MTIAQLKAVSAVMTGGSISIAARKLYLSQPAVTKQIRALEEELSVSLFERSGKRLIPTRAAHELLPRIEELISGMEGLKHHLSPKSDAKAEIRGVACIGAGIVFSQTKLPAAIALCRQRHPGIQLVIFEGATRELLQRLRQGEVRVSLGIDYLKNPDFRFTPLLDDELVLIVPEKHPLAKGKGRVSLAKVIEEESLVTHTFAGGMENALRRAGIPRRLLMKENELGLRTTNNQTIVAMVAAGLGVSIVPGYLIKLMECKNVVIRKLDHSIPVKFGYYQLRDTSLNPAETAFLEVIQEIMSNQTAVPPGR